MPTNEELQEQINKLQEQVAANKKAQKDRWSDSPWAIALQFLIAIAAVAIAWAQFNAAAIQTELSSKQTGLQEFEIIKSLSSLDPNDSLEVNNLFDYISTLDNDLQQRFLNNTLANQSVNYFSYKSYHYLFEHFEFDTVAMIGSMMEKLGNYMTNRRLDEISDNKVALTDYALMDDWIDLITSRTDELSFQSRQRLVTQHSKEFVNGIMMLRKIIAYQAPPADQLQEDIVADTSLIFKLIPYDSRLISSIFGKATSTRDLRPWLRKMTVYDLGGGIQQVMAFADLIFNDYLPDQYELFLLYLSEAKSQEEYLKYLPLCEKMIATQLEKRDDLTGLTVKVTLPGSGIKKKIESSHRVWINREGLALLKQQFDKKESYDPEIISK